jgi:putative acetyltransferase
VEIPGLKPSNAARAAAPLQIRVDDLQGAEIIALLREHLEAMRSTSPPGSCHVLDLHELRAPKVTFWSIWDGDQLVGCGALKELSTDHAEIKSMRTAREHLRKGVASQVLEHLVVQARKRGYRRLSLETGARPSGSANVRRSAITSSIRTACS